MLLHVTDENKRKGNKRLVTDTHRPVQRDCSRTQISQYLGSLMLLPALARHTSAGCTHNHADKHESVSRLFHYTTQTKQTHTCTQVQYSKPSTLKETHYG